MANVVVTYHDAEIGKVKHRFSNAWAEEAEDKDLVIYRQKEGGELGERLGRFRAVLYWYIEEDSSKEEDESN